MSICRNLACRYYGEKECRCYRTDYDILKALGHTPSKALEITIDAQRGDLIAKQWIDEARAIIEKAP